MGILDKIFGRDEKDGATERTVLDAEPQCSHTALTPHWENPEEMGKEDRATYTCEACGETFTCGPLAKGGCWCMQENVPPERLEELKAQYARCLCPACLRKAASGGRTP